jgi:hypothetical protein
MLFAAGGNQALLAQATEGSILGTVTDDSGATVTGAEVSVTSVETNYVRKTITNSAGEYVVSNLPLGSYTVSAEMPGFKKSVHGALQMTVKARIRVDLQLHVGEVSQAVEVVGAAPLLKTDSPEVSTLITQQQLSSLPSQNRHFLSMAVLTPGTYRYWTAGGGDRVGDFSGGESIAVGGLNSGQNNFILDGVSNNVELTGGLNAVPAIDAIQEVSVQTNSYSSEFGRSAGAVVNVAMKSGSNELHGFAYDYLQNDKFNARSYDFSGTHPAITPLRKNLFGGGVSGPIKKNKIFFFANYEGLRQPATVIEYDVAPTALERKGDFSQSGWTVYDPATTKPDGTRSAFPGNVIPASRISLLMQDLISIYPLPNYKDPNPSVLNNYLAYDRNNDAKDAFNLKGDVNLSAKDTMTLRYSKQYYSKDRSGWVTDNYIGGHGSLNGTNAGFTETHVFTPNLLNEVRVGWNYVHDGNAPLNNTVLDALKQIPGGLPSAGYPTVSMRNITSTKAVRPLTTLPNPYILWQNSLEYMDNVSWHKGKHALKFGIDFIHHRNDVGGSGAAGGIKFSIDGYQTVAAVGAKRPNNLTGTADGLLGLANQLTTYYVFDKTRMRDNRLSAFVQDEWRATKKLSLSLGLRYEWFPTFTVVGDRQTNFDFATGKVLVPQEARGWVQQFLGFPDGNLPPGYQYLPGNQVLGKNIGVDLSPRIGFAYSITPWLVLRGGYGIFHTVPAALDVNNTVGAPFSFQVQLTGDTATPIVVANGFPSSNIYETLNSNAIPPAQFQGRYYDPYVQKYGMNLQVMPLRKTAIEVGYEGNHAIRLDVSTRLNYPTPAPGDINARRPYPQWGEGFGIEFTGYSHFNAFEMTVRQQLTHGFTVYSQLTLQHSYGAVAYVDPYNWNYGRGTLAIDTAHQWASSVIYDAPSLRQQPWMLRQPFGGWQIAAIYQLRGGLPFSVNSSQAMNDDIDASRANLTLANGPAALPTGQRSINRWFNTNAFTTPADYTWGNSGFNILRGPGWSELELAVQKSFSITESKKLTFRAEAQNALNRVNLGQPSATLGAAALGTIRSLNGDPRLMQMVLKFAF